MVSLSQLRAFQSRFHCGVAITTTWSKDWSGGPNVVARQQTSRNSVSNF